MPPALKKDSDEPKKRDRKSLSFGFKYEIIRRLESGVLRSVISKEFGIADSTIRNIIKDSHKIKCHLQKRRPSTQLKANCQIFEEMESRLVQFIGDTKKNGGLISKRVICIEARRLFEELKQKYSGPKNFYASKTWYAKFDKKLKENSKQSNGTVTFASVVDRSKDQEMVGLDLEAVECYLDDHEVDNTSLTHDRLESLEIQKEVGPVLTSEVIWKVMHHIDSAIQLLAQHDDDSERVSAVQRNISDAVAAYKEILATRRQKPKQFEMYSFLKSVAKNSEVE